MHSAVIVSCSPFSLLRGLLPPGECVAAVKQAMQGVSAGKVLMPLRQFMSLPSGDCKLAWMPGYLADPECFGIKLLSLLAGGKGRFRSLPFASAWTAVRDLPAPQGETFMAQWQRRKP